MPNAKENDQQKVIDVMKGFADSLIGANGEDALKALDAQIKEDEGSNKIVVTLRMTIEKTGDVHDVTPVLKYSQAVQHEDSLPKVSIDPNQPDLPGV